MSELSQSKGKSLSRSAGGDGGNAKGMSPRKVTKSFSEADCYESFRRP
jgi:hypothetical protein